MRIHPLQTGEVRIKESQRRGVGTGWARRLRPIRDPEWTPWLPILAWAIEHPEGLIVVDTGETARVHEPGWFPRWHPFFRFATRFRVRPQDEIGPRMRAAGLDPRDVRTVVLTHLHTDHAGGLHHFPRARVLAGAADVELARSPRARLEGMLPHRWPAWLELEPVTFDTAQAFGPFEAGRALTEAGDVRIVPTPGHTPGHQAVVVDEGDRVVMLAGDVSDAQEIMLEGRIDSIAEDEAVARDTLARVRRLCEERPTVFLPAHDEESVARLEGRMPAL